jgi:Rieske Fe-S protein
MKISRREAIITLGAIGATGCMPIRENPGANLNKAGLKVATINEFPSVGSFKNLNLESNPAIIARVAKPQAVGISLGEIHLIARSTVCTHVGCGVSAPVNNQLGCPCHGSLFNLETGEVIQGPANKPLPAFKLEARSDGIYVIP